MRLPMFLIVCVATMATGCPSTDPKTTTGPSPSPSPTTDSKAETPAARLDQAKRDTKAAARAWKEYAFSQKAELVADMKRELVAIEAEIDRLAAKVDSATGQAKLDAKVKLDALRTKAAEARRRVDAAEQAGESDWDQVKRGLDESYGDLKGSFDETRQWLSDKIEPS